MHTFIFDNIFNYRQQQNTEQTKPYCQQGGKRHVFFITGCFAFASENGDFCVEQLKNPTEM